MTDLRTSGWPIQIKGTFWNILKSRIIKHNKESMHTKQGNCMYIQNFIYGIQCRKLFFPQSKQMYCFLHVHREKVTERKSQRERNKKRETPVFSNRCLSHQPTAQEASFRCPANQPHTYTQTHKYSSLDYTCLRTRTRTVANTTGAYLLLLYFLVHFESAFEQLLPL